MDLIGTDGMTIQIAHTLDRERLSVDDDFIGFHNLILVRLLVVCHKLRLSGRPKDRYMGRGEHIGGGDMIRTSWIASPTSHSRTSIPASLIPVSCNRERWCKMEGEMRKRRERKDTSSVSHGLLQVVKLRVSGPRERTVDDASVDMRSKIDLHDVTVS